MTNVTSFGAFVDLGVGVDALLHHTKLGAGVGSGDGVSNMAALDAVWVGQRLHVRVESIDRTRGRPRIAIVPVLSQAADQSRLPDHVAPQCPEGS